ncbi:MAG: RNA methyltransferase [Chlorobiaceae bacterium]
MKPYDPAPLSKAKLKQYALLHQKKQRDAEKLFLAEGLRTVRELCLSLPSEEMLVALLIREKGVELEPFLRSRMAKVFSITEKECAHLAQTSTPQGVFGVFRQQSGKVPASAKAGGSFLLALDDVQDPGNVGTILRTAAWFGADRVICSHGTADRYNPKAVRSCAGSIYALHHDGVVSLREELSRLQEEGYSIACASLEGKDFREFISWPEKLVLVIGNEANGVSKEIQALADRLIKIPHVGKKARVESLNAAVSAAILMERLALS